MAKKSAIEARQGHPTGIIDDAGKAIGKAVNRYGARRTLGDDVITSASRAVKDRNDVVQNAYGKYYAYWKPEIKAKKKAAKKVSRNLRSTQLPKAKDNIKAKVAARKENKYWMMPDGVLEPRRTAKKLLKQEKARVSKKYGTK